MEHLFGVFPLGRFSLFPEWFNSHVGCFVARVISIVALWLSASVQESREQGEKLFSMSAVGHVRVSIRFSLIGRSGVDSTCKFLPLACSHSDEAAINGVDAKGQGYLARVVFVPCHGNAS